MDEHCSEEIHFLDFFGEIVNAGGGDGVFLKKIFLSGKIGVSNVDRTAY